MPCYDCYRNGKRTESDRDAWVNACSMILGSEAFRYIEEFVQKPDGTNSVMDCIASKEAVQTYKHDGFWSPVETIRDKTWLESLWKENGAPWKTWEEKH